MLKDKNKNRKTEWLDFPNVTMDENLPANAGDRDLIPDPGKFHMS